MNIVWCIVIFPSNSLQYMFSIQLKNIFHSQPRASRADRSLNGSSLFIVWISACWFGYPMEINLNSQHTSCDKVKHVPSRRFCLTFCVCLVWSFWKRIKCPSCLSLLLVAHGESSGFQFQLLNSLQCFVQGQAEQQCHLSLFVLSLCPLTQMILSECAW